MKEMHSHQYYAQNLTHTRMQTHHAMLDNEHEVIDIIATLCDKHSLETGD